MIGKLSRLDSTLGTSRKRDDILIYCTGYEDRSVSISQKLGDYDFDVCYLLRYTNENGELPVLANQITQNLSEKGKVVPFQINGYKPMPVIRNIWSQISQMGHNLKVSLNISTMTKELLLQLLYYLCFSDQVKEITILYTEPNIYGRILNDREMTEGISEVQSILPFEGQSSPTKENLLVEILGFERERAFAVWDSLEFHDTLLLIPKPAYREEWNTLTESFNSSLLEIVGRGNSRELDSRDPLKVEEQLHQYLSEPEYSGENWNYYLCPLGTKLQTVGMFLFMMDSVSLPTVVYARPFKHNYNFSKGSGPSWLFSFEIRDRKPVTNYSA